MLKATWAPSYKSFYKNGLTIKIRALIYLVVIYSPTRKITFSLIHTRKVSEELLQGRDRMLLICFKIVVNLFQSGRLPEKD